MDYRRLTKQVRALAEDAPWEITFLSNVSALLYEEMEDVNWAGFYLLREKELLLGPFQGRPACVRIPSGKGVCGAALERERTVRVQDVRSFAGHIACDSASRSEIVIPLCADGKIAGVLDIDSPTIGRFTEEDERGLEKIAEVIGDGLSHRI